MPLERYVSVEGDLSIDNVGVTSVPTDPFGANADAAVDAGAAGSHSAKLRRLTADLATSLGILGDIETSLETLGDIEGLLQDIETSTNTVAGAVDTEVQVDVVTQPALVRTTDAVAAALQSDAVMVGGSALTPKFAFANVAASQTDANLVTAVSGKRIRVLQVAAVTGGTATNLTFNTKPGGAGTAISPLFANGVNGGEVLPFSPVGWFQTGIGEGLTVTTGSGSSTGILVAYIEV